MNRYCEGCKHDHGPLYVCESYSDELKKEITEDAALWKKNVNDPEWVKRRLGEGVHPLVVMACQVFAE